jgi:hypothetical protein
LNLYRPRHRPARPEIHLLTALLAGLLSVGLMGCHKAAKPAKVHVVPPLVAVAAAEVPAPPKPSVLLEKGMTLSKIAKEAYGHEKFSGFVASYNHIEDPTKLKIGAEIRTPAIPQAFADEGMDAKYQPAINALAKAAHDYFTLLPAYRAAVKPGTAKSGEATKVTVPADLKTKLESIADQVEAASAVLAAAAPPHKAPQATVGQFKQAMVLLRSLALGKVDSEGYDNDVIGQRFGSGMTDALIWTQQRHQ